MPNIPRLYEPIILPDNSNTVVGTARDQATIALDRAILPVEPRRTPVTTYGERVYVDTQATREPETAATEQAITERMRTGRYEEQRLDPGVELETVDVTGEQAGGIMGPHQVVVPAEVLAVTNKAFNDAQAVLTFAQSLRLTAEQAKWVADFQGEVVGLSTAMAAFDAATDVVRSSIDVNTWIPVAQSISNNAAILGNLLMQAPTASGVPWWLIGAVAVGAWLLLRK